MQKLLFIVLTFSTQSMRANDEYLINETAKEYYVPLFHAAVIANNTTYIQKMLNEDKTLINFPVEKWGGSKPLYFATRFNSYEALQLLLKNGAHVNENIDKNKTTALHIASQRNNLTIAELLIKHGASIDPQDDLKCTPLYYAVFTKSYDVATLLLSKGANKSLKNVYSDCPFGIARDDQKMLNIFRSYRKSTE